MPILSCHILHPGGRESTVSLEIQRSVFEVKLTDIGREITIRNYNRLITWSCDDSIGIAYTTLDSRRMRTLIADLESIKTAGVNS